MVQISGDGQNETGALYGVNGLSTPFAGLSWLFNGPASANNQDMTSSFVATSGVLPVDQYPQFDSQASARWAKPGGPFDPHTGNQYVYSQLADASYKRLTREIAVPVGGGDLTFWTSHDTEEEWDYLAVEARTAGGSDWTTLPDANGHTTHGHGPELPGDATGWADELHPHLTHYQTYVPGSPATCTPTGTTGVWNAATGNSDGWQQWSIDLDKWAGKTVEISIAYISDWGTQNLGVFLDDFTWPGGSTSFEGGDTGGWQIGGPPEGSGANANNWKVTDAGGFPVGAAITTPKSLLFGSGSKGSPPRTSATRSWGGWPPTSCVSEHGVGARFGGAGPRPRAQASSRAISSSRSMPSCMPLSIPVPMIMSRTSRLSTRDQDRQRGAAAGSRSRVTVVHASCALPARARLRRPRSLTMPLVRDDLAVTRRGRRPRGRRRRPSRSATRRRPAGRSRTTRHLAAPPGPPAADQLRRRCRPCRPGASVRRTPA